MKKLLNTTICLSLLYFTQTFGQASVNSNNQSTNDKQFSDILAADQAMQKGNYKAAIILYRQYLNKNPNDKDIVITLFRLQLMQGNYPEAKQILAMYSKRFGNDDAYLAEKARYYVAVNKSDEALKTILDHKNYSLTSILTAAKNSIQNKNYKKAIFLYQQYIKQNPNDKAAMIALIQVQLIHGSIDNAEQLLADYLDRFEKDKAYLTEKARYYALNDQPDKAIATLGPLLKNDPTNKVLLYIEQYALNQQEHQNQELILDEAKQAAENKDTLKAIRFYQRYLNKNPNNKSVMISLIQLYLSQKNFEVANKFLATYSTKFGNDNAFLTEKARYLMLTNQISDSLSIVNPLIAKDPTNTTLLNIQQEALKIKSREEKATENLNLITQAKQALQDSDNQKAIALYTQYLQRNPKDKVVTLTLIQLQLAQNNLEAVKSLLIMYMGNFGKDDTYFFEKAHYFTLIEKPNEALALLGPLLRKNPSQNELLELKQKALDIKDRQDKAALETILASAKESAQKNDYKNAIVLYQQYLLKNPKDKSVVLTVIDLELLQANQAGVEKLLKLYSKQFGKDEDYYVSNSRFLILTNKPVAALSVLDSLLQKNPSNNKLLELKQTALKLQEQQAKLTLTTMLVDAAQAIEQHDYKKGIELYHQYLSKEPQDRAILLALIDLELKQADYKETERLLSEYAKQFSKDNDYLITNIRYLTLTNKPEQALEIIEHLLKQHPFNRRLLDLKQYTLQLKAQHEKIIQQKMLASANQALQQKDYVKAITLFQQYLTKNPNQKNILLTLIDLELHQANYIEAEKLLSKYDYQFGKDNNYSIRLAQYFSLNNKPEQVLNVIEPLLKDNPNNKTLFSLKQHALNVITNKLKAENAILLTSAKKAIEEKNYKQSLELYQQYINKNPNDKQAMSALIDLELQLTNFSGAEKFLSLYASQFGKDDNYTILNTRYLTLTNKPEEALAALEPLLRLNQNNQTLQLLKQQALNLKQRHDKAISENILATAKQAMSHKDYKQVIILYQQYIEKNPTDKKIMLTLIELELQQKDFNDAEKSLSLYATQFGKDDTYLILNIRYLTLANKPEEALVSLEPLLQLDPSNQTLQALKQQALNLKLHHDKETYEKLLADAKQAIGQKNYNLGIALYEQYIDKNPTDKKIILTLIELELRQTNFAEAEKFLLMYANRFGKDIDYSIKNVDYLISINKPDEALIALETLLKNNPKNKKLLALKQDALSLKIDQSKINLQTMLASAKKAVEQKDYNNGIALYQQYLDKNPNDKSAALSLIDLELQQAKLADAEKMLDTYLNRFGNDDNYLTQKARHHILSQHPELALSILDSLLKKDPSNQILLHVQQDAINLKAHQEKVSQQLIMTAANNAIHLKDYKKAITLYQEYLAKNPADKIATLTLIDLELQQANYTDVEKLFSIYSSKFGDDDASTLSKARFYILTNKSEEALKILDPLFQKNPGNKHVLEVRQIALNNTKKKQEEQKLKDNAIAQNTMNQHNGTLAQSDQDKNDKAILISHIQSAMIYSNYPQAQKLLSEYANKFGKDESYLIIEKRYQALNQKPETITPTITAQVELATQDFQKTSSIENDKENTTITSSTVTAQTDKTESDSQTPLKETHVENDYEDTTAASSTVTASTENTESGSKNLPKASHMKNDNDTLATSSSDVIAQTEKTDLDSQPLSKTTYSDTYTIRKNKEKQHQTKVQIRDNKFTENEIVTNSKQPNKEMINKSDEIKSNENYIPSTSRNYSEQQSNFNLKHSYEKYTRQFINHKITHSVSKYISYLCQPQSLYHYKKIRVYLGAMAGYSDFQIRNHNYDFRNEEGIAGRIYLGLNFNPNLGAELGGTFYPDTKMRYNHFNEKISQKSIELLGKLTIPLTCDFSFNVKAGEAYLHRNSNAYNEDITQNLLRPVVSFGASYAMTQTLNAEFSYTHLFYEEENIIRGINFYGIGLSYKFK